MGILDQRIGSRDLRTTLKDVYGINPFDTVRQLNKPLESVLGKLKDLRRSLGAVQDLVDKFKGIKGAIGSFSLDSLKREILDALGINIFMRTIEDIKAEAEAIMSMLGLNSSASIDRLNSVSDYTVEQWQLQLDNILNNQISDVVYNQLDEVISTGTTDTNVSINTGTPSVIPSVEDTVTTPTVPDPAVVTCDIPEFVTDSTLLEVLSALGVTIDSTVAGSHVDTSSPVTPTTVTNPVSTTASNTSSHTYPVLDVIVIIVLIAIITGDYTAIGNLPIDLQHAVADVLVAIGIDTSNIDAILAGLQYGDVQQLLEHYPGLLDMLLALAQNMQSVVGVINQVVPPGSTPITLLPEVVYDNLLTTLPPVTTVIPTPFISAIQAIVVLAIKMPSVPQRRVVKVNYLHSYYPRS